MKQYETYKDSGIEWIGEIPEHWEIVPLKYRFAFSKGLSITKEDLVSEGVPVISYGQVHSKVNPGTTTHDHLLRFVPSTTTNKFESAKVNVGDFIFADTSEDLEGCGNCAYIDRDGIYAGYHTIVFHSLYPSDNKYLAYLFLTDEWRSQIRSSVMGTKVYSITQNILSKVSIILPPQEERARIAAWLDWKIGQVDAIVAEKEAMVADLQSYRQSVITESVTRGLNPDASLHPSGIEWLGDIPDHWSIIPLKYLLKEAMMYGANETAEDEVFACHPRYIRITDISENGLLKPDTYKTLSPEKAEFYLLEKGDILFARSGATVGKTYRFNESYPCCFAGYLIKAACAEKLNSEFLLYYTNSIAYNNWRDSIYDQSTIPNISADKYNKLPVPVPPIAEQKALTEFLDKKTAEIDALLSDLREQIADLRSYKASLISEAVTGKIDLRDWEPKN